MVVSYLVKEQADLVGQSGEWLEKVKALGLEGQSTLMAEDEKSPVPFMRMTAGHVRLFTALCPKRVDITAFSVEPIPMEALALVGLALTEQHFDTLEVWYADGQATTDPVVVGTRGKGKDADRYLVAQWGVEDASMDRLYAIARERLIRTGRSHCESQVKQAQGHLDNVEAQADQYLNGVPYINNYAYGWPEIQ